MLDSIIRSLSLTLLDADNPGTTMFLPGTVPVVPVRDQQGTSWFDYQPLTPSHQATQNTDAFYVSTSSPVIHHPASEVGCSCTSLTLGKHWPSTNEHAPLWSSTPAWNDSWSDNEIRKESIRRLCWSAMVAAAGHISYTTAHRSHNPDLFIADPANVSHLIGCPLIMLLIIHLVLSMHSCSLGNQSPSHHLCRLRQRTRYGPSKTDVFYCGMAVYG